MYHFLGLNEGREKRTKTCKQSRQKREFYPQVCQELPRMSLNMFAFAKFLLIKEEASTGEY